jgi:hypothetical protein
MRVNSTSRPGTDEGERRAAPPDRLHRGRPRNRSEATRTLRPDRSRPGPEPGVATAPIDETPP